MVHAFSEDIQPMIYTMRSLSGGGTLDALAMHVFARAYRTAWRTRYGTEPAGSHVIARLDLVIEFGKELTSGLTDV